MRFTAISIFSAAVLMLGAFAAEPVKVLPSDVHITVNTDPDVTGKAGQQQNPQQQIQKRQDSQAQQEQAQQQQQAQKQQQQQAQKQQQQQEQQQQQQDTQQGDPFLQELQRGAGALGPLDCVEKTTTGVQGTVGTLASGAGSLAPVIPSIPGTTR